MTTNRPTWPNGEAYPGDVWHEYGPRRPIWTPNGYTSSFHSGIDIGPWDGAGRTWLLAPDNGLITHAGYDRIFGNRVVVSSWYGRDRVEYWLCHGRTGSMQVDAGERVHQGQRLQLMGETGKASGEHVHFEVHVNGERVDPRDFYARPTSGGTASPSTPEGEEEEIMKYGQLHCTRPDGKMLRRALYAPGTAYFVFWDGDDPTMANFFSRHFDTGGSLEVTFDIFEQFRKAAANAAS